MYEAIAALGAAALLIAVIAYRAYQAGRTAETAETQSRVLEEVAKAADIDAEIRSLPSDVIDARLRKWTRD